MRAIFKNTIAGERKAEFSTIDDGAKPATHRVDGMHSVLASLPAEVLEILNRFYAKGQSPGLICADMKLTENEFQRLKTFGREQVVLAQVRHETGETDVSH